MKTSKESTRRLNIGQERKRWTQGKMREEEVGPGENKRGRIKDGQNVALVTMHFP